MCTVSVIPPGPDRGLRLVMNRDERRTRLAAWPPMASEIEGRTMIAPTDADGLGTWIAAGDTGLVWALMNIHPAGRLMPRAPARSRGEIVPALASAADVPEALRRFAHLSLDAFAPFRLLVAGQGSLAAFEWDGWDRRATREPLVHARSFASSSLGDALVEGPRQRLFESLLASEADPWRAQDRLHVHAWPDRRHLSVLMTRPTARTVSRTAVVVADTHVEMAYAPIVDGWPGPVAIERVAYRARYAARPA